jgi:hypothetical protein
MVRLRISRDIVFGRWLAHWERRFLEKNSR